MNLPLPLRLATSRAAPFLRVSVTVSVTFLPSRLVAAPRSLPLAVPPRAAVSRTSGSFPFAGGSAVVTVYVAAPGLVPVSVLFPVFVLVPFPSPRLVPRFVPLLPALDPLCLCFGLGLLALVAQLE
jgi:hypothetical protein